jgi:D-alanyl-D-alanine carboxypeptidase/D-alanyl-D-alanine-endopeptidase (penicillin-binding protein 4)
MMVACAVAGAQAPASQSPASQTSLRQQIEAMVQESGVVRAHWGVIVTAMDGTVLYSLNEGQLFQPASNAKLFTTAAALALLKGGSHFDTQIFAEAAPVAGILKGNLVIRGDGDANLSGRSIPYAAPSASPNGARIAQAPLHLLDEMADQIAATGLKRIEGDIVGDDTLFPWEPYAEDWVIDDMVWGYGAPVSALSINDNQIRLSIVPGKVPPIPAGAARGPYGDPEPATITLDPATPFYTIKNEIGTVQGNGGGGIGIERQPGSRTLRIYSGLTEAPEVEEIAIDDPAEYAAASLKLRLEARGIIVTGKAAARHRLQTNTTGLLEQSRVPIVDLGAGAEGGIAPCLRCKVHSGSSQDVVLAHHTSPTVAEDVVVTNKTSQNLHAELLLHQLAVAFGEDGSTAQGARVVRQFLLNAGVDKDDFVFYDGSGLSGHDLVTPRATARLLQFAALQPWFAEFKASLPVGGVDGSLTHRFTAAPLKGHVFAKTGTLGEARALSGYIECASGRTVIFSVMVGDHDPGASADRDVIDRIVGAIAAAE